MKEKTCLRLKGSTLILLEKLKLALHQHFFMAIRVCQLNLPPIYLIHLLTTFYPQKVSNLLSLQTWFMTSLFIIFVFQLNNRFLFFVLFCPNFIFLLVFSFFQVHMLGYYHFHVLCVFFKYIANIEKKLFLFSVLVFIQVDGLAINQILYFTKKDT